MILRCKAAAALLTAASAVAISRAGAQHEGHRQERTARAIVFGVGASAIAVGTQVDPGVSGRQLREGYLTQPMLHAHASAWRGTLGVQAMIDFEGATLKRGELAPGASGEGYVDRRHPHTWVHELVASVSTPPLHGAALSISGGKGFAPFGTDDPMVRPLERFPVNHHLAQILERAVVVAAVRWRPLIIEAATFNGDEPESPTDAPNAANFGDSWAGRVTLRLLDGFELQVSNAFVNSPESPGGHAPDHRQRSGSIRVAQRTRAGDVYALAEWATTHVSKDGRDAGRLGTALVEASLSRRSWTVAGRYERSVRPEEERLANPFRTPFPTAEVQILGRTRFDIATATVSRPWRPLGIEFAPFIEISLITPRAIALPAAFVPNEFYGRDRISTISAGIRFSAGVPHRRAGRYAVANAPDTGVRHPSSDQH